jgi:membrane dipeptidase
MERRGMDREDYLGYKAVRDELAAASPPPRATLAQVADHIEHVRDVAGADHVGIGSDFDGTTDLPEGVGDVSCYPALFAELLARGWSEDDCARLAGGNVLRVMRDAEAFSRAAS